jgi:hypothetical protein
MRPAALLLLALSACAHTSTADEVEPYFLTVEHGDAAQAMAAGEKLAAAYDDAHLPRLEKTLAAKPVRAIQLIGDLSSDGSARLLLNHLPYFLESKDPEVARMAAVVAGLRRLKPATAALLHHSEEPAVVRALGRIWEQDLDSQPLPREEEIDRLTVFAVVHRQAMGPNPSVEACEAMLSVMTAAELADFLAKHAADKFPARRHCDEAVRRPDFDADKGQRVHEALLRSPDVNLVSGILESSPFPLEESLVQALLKDDRTVKEGVRVGDVAARRLKR